MGTITINGVNYTGSNICIRNNHVVVDGKDITPDLKEINIQVQGDIQQLVVDSCNAITVHGNVGNLNSTSGDVTCQNVGSLQTTSGDVEAQDVTGNVRTVSGDVRAKTIHGGTSTVSGKIAAK